MTRFWHKTAIIWICGLIAASLVWGLAALPAAPLSPLNLLVFDTYQRLKPRVWAGSDIVIVDLDEASIREVGQWPWPRTALAEMTDRLHELGAAAIVFDIVFSEPDRTSPWRAVDDLRKAGVSVPPVVDTSVLDNDLALAKSFAKATVVTGMQISQTATDKPPRPKAGSGFIGTPPSRLMTQNVAAVRNLPILDDAAVGTGEFSFDSSRQTDAVVRFTRLMRGANDAWYPSLALETLRVVQGAGGFKIKSTDGSGEANTADLALVAVQVGALDIPVNADGAIAIYHSPVGEKPVLSARHLLARNASGPSTSDLQDTVTNHIVLVGTSAAGLLDLRATPLHPIVPGVTIHADIIDQIIAGDFLKRSDIAPGVDLAAAVVAIVMLLAAAPLLSGPNTASVMLVLGMTVIGGFWYAFAEHGLLFSPVIAILSLIATYAVAVAVDLLVTEREGTFVRDAFGHYLAPALVEELARNPEKLSLGGEERKLTILFCDIRGFTSLSEGLGAVELTELLNDFLTPMTTALLNRGATIDKYMGDAIMAFWNAPLDQEDHRMLACKAMIDMRRKLKRLNAEATHPINIGIGINTGMCCVGNLGSAQRFNYSAIGDAVNITARIESLTKFYGLDNLVTLDTVKGLKDPKYLEVDTVVVKGREAPITVCTLLNRIRKLDKENFLQLRKDHVALLHAYRNADVEQGLVALARCRQSAQVVVGGALSDLYDLYDRRFDALTARSSDKTWDPTFRPDEK